MRDALTNGGEGVNTMKKALSVIFVVALVATLTGVALAWGPARRGLGTWL